MTNEHHLTRRIFKLASNRLWWKVGDPYVYPYDVDLIIENGTWTIGFGEGVGHASVGAVVSAEEALEPGWSEHIRLAEGQWVLPYVQRIHAGTEVSPEEIVEEFERRHGRAPRILDEFSSIRPPLLGRAHR